MPAPLNLPDFEFAIRGVGETRFIFDPLRRQYVKLTPEEWVRQHFVQFLIQDRGYRRGLLAIEKGFVYEGRARRADVVAYSSSGKALLVVECKAPDVPVSQATFDQISRYNTVLGARFLAVTNGIVHYCCEIDHERRTCHFIDHVPAYDQIARASMTPFSSLKVEAEVALAAVREAARLCESVRRELDRSTLHKEDLSPVTIADFGSQALICDAIRQAFPEDVVIAEEDADALRRTENAPLLQRLLQHVRELRPEMSSDAVLAAIDQGAAGSTGGRFWTLDPIDGTKGFLRGDQYAIALALVEDGVLRVAALACPQLTPSSGDGAGCIFLAVSGAGAVELPCFGEGEARPITTRNGGEPSRWVFCESYEGAHSSHRDAARIAARLGMKREPLRLDSQAKYGLVARGDADFYIRVPKGDGYRERIWDHAAGALVVAEAGGIATDLDGAALDFTHGRTLAENKGVLVAGTAAHPHILKALKQEGIGDTNPSR